jgi:hypothetical protein
MSNSSRKQADPFSGAWLSDHLHSAHLEMQKLVHPVMQARWSEHQAGRLSGEDLLGRRLILRVGLHFAGRPAAPEQGRPEFPAISKLWDIHIIAHPNGRVWRATVEGASDAPSASQFELLDSEGSLANWDDVCFFEAMLFVEELHRAGAVTDVEIEAVLRFHVDQDGIACADGRVQAPYNRQLTLTGFTPAGLGVAPLLQPQR